MAFEVSADPAALQYATTADAFAASALVVGGDAFDALSDVMQNKLLITASRDLDTSDWIGARASTTQAREWPRTGTAYGSDTWPLRLVDATIALAWAHATTLADDPAADLLTASTNNIKEDTVGPITTIYFDRGKPAATALERFPDYVQRLIAPLVRVDAVSGWGSAAVLRSS